MSLFAAEKKNILVISESCKEKNSNYAILMIFLVAENQQKPLVSCTCVSDQCYVVHQLQAQFRSILTISPASEHGFVIRWFCILIRRFQSCRCMLSWMRRFHKFASALSKIWPFVSAHFSIQNTIKDSGD